MSEEFNAYDNPRMQALCTEQIRELSKLTARQAQHRVRLALELKREWLASLDEGSALEETTTLAGAMRQAVYGSTSNPERYSCLGCGCAISRLVSRGGTAYWVDTQGGSLCPSWNTVFHGPVAIEEES